MKISAPFGERPEGAFLSFEADGFFSRIRLRKERKFDKINREFAYTGKREEA